MGSGQGEHLHHPVKTHYHPMIPKNYPKLTVIANDSHTPLMRNLNWPTSMFKFPKLIGISVPIFGTISRFNQVEYVGSLERFAECHKEIREKAEQDNGLVDWIMNKSISIGKAMNKWTEKNLFKADLKSKTNKELVDLYFQFNDIMSTTYTYGVTMPLLDFHNFSYVEGNLNKIIERLPENEKRRAHEAFTEPLHDSFAMEQEKKLLRLITPHYHNNHWRQAVTKDWDAVKREQPNFAKKLKKHTQKYGWVYYVYQGPVFGEQEFLGFIVDFLKFKKTPKDKLKEFKTKAKRIKQWKSEFLKELKPTIFEKGILYLAGKMVWGKPRRKDLQSKSYYHVEPLMREIARRLHISLNQARTIPADMLEGALKKGTIDHHFLNELERFHITLPVNNKAVYYFGKEAEKIYALMERPEKKNYAKIDQVEGTPACRGKAKGRVKIINVPEEMHKMKDGDILVSNATTPSIVPAMKKAAAIITSEGGLTCHAAIVSREMGTPCIVGTKIATKVFKDNDLVEVDAITGIAKKVK